MDFTATMMKGNVHSDTDSDLYVHYTVSDIDDVLDSSGNSTNSEDTLPSSLMKQTVPRRFPDHDTTEKETISFRRVQRFTNTNYIKEDVHSDTNSASDLSVHYTLSDIDDVLDSSGNNTNSEDVHPSSVMKQNFPRGEDHVTTENETISFRSVQRFTKTNNYIPKERISKVTRVYPVPPSEVSLTSKHTRLYTDSFRRFSPMRQAMRKPRTSPSAAADETNNSRSSRPKHALFRLYGHTLMCLGTIDKKPKAL